GLAPHPPRVDPVSHLPPGTAHSSFGMKNTEKGSEWIAYARPNRLISNYFLVLSFRYMLS
ncbi:unnamed protein product, partial [Cercopithifilaria johnstoni]